MKTILSGIRPTGDLHLGNYLGSIANWLSIQKEYEGRYVFVANLHALTTEKDAKLIREKTLEVVKLYLSLGLRPQDFTIFVQSQIPAHAELAWILSCLTKMNELTMMTQYKEKKGRAGNNAGLFGYPVLMAADILLYRPEAVPVGADQKQHVELARDLAERFNKTFGKVLTVPKFITPKQGTKIMSLANPDKKMSKSDDDPRGTINLLDKPADIRKKIMSATTDSDGLVKYDPKKKPGVSNLLTIMAAVTQKQMEEIEQDYSDRGYADFKKDLAEAVVDLLAPIQKKYHSLSTKEVERIIEAGRKKAAATADETLREVKNKAGLL